MAINKITIIEKQKKFPQKNHLCQKNFLETSFDEESIKLRKRWFENNKLTTVNIKEIEIFNHENLEVR